MKYLLPTKFKVVLLFVFLFSLLGSSFYAGKVLAADAFPPPGRIPCTETRANEFSSDRPYQGSPCGERPITYFCGNTVVIYLGTVSVPYCDEQDGNLTSCPVPGGQQHHDQTIDVDLTDVELPILGNTELTINNQNKTDQIDDGTKVSSYVAWYLNGTDGKAEYPISKTATADEIAKTVDTAGPINKLLPQAIANAQRIDTIITASKNDPAYTDEETGELVPSQPSNHDQIVVCANGGNPVECDKGGKKYRLKDWDDGKLSLLSTFFNFLGAEIWNNKYPPLPWQFTKEIFYEKAYNEWRGSTCVIVPIIDRLVCADIPLVSPTRVWADLFPYVPLANTVDKKGSQIITDTNIQAPKATLENTSSEINNIPQLYLAHSLENSKLAALLKSTFKPKDNLVGSTTPKDVEDNSTTCRILNSRTNPGDDATFGTPKSHINVDVHYDVTKINCSDPKYNCSALGCYWRAKCESEIYATIPSISKTPYADEIWKDTVAGSDSIFRRIYPKTGSNSPVSCIADTPAVSAATYTLNEDLSSSGLQITKVVEPDGSDVLAQTGTNAVAAQLYYPHYGGVLDYFLKGIQTALRPQGYADSTPQSGQYCDNLACGELPKLPKASGSCNLGGISSRVGKIPKSLKDIIEAAAQTYKVPPNLILGIMYGEGLFDPGRFNWTDQNVKNWATCQKIPGCKESGDDNFMGFNGNDFTNISPHIKADIQKLDPSRKKLSQCNLLDAIYAEAWNLHDSADGGGGLPPTCFGIGLRSSVPSSCSWNNEQYESAIKVAESGYSSDCLTLVGGCLMGGGLGAACPNGDGCETLGNHSTAVGTISHNACIWEVGHGRL